MKALIQHNISSGFGDTIVSIFEFLNTSRNLIKKGYTVSLKINLIRNSYFDNKSYFDFFNEKEFEIFDSIEILETPITTVNFENLTRIYTLSMPSPGGHWWDLFVENGYDESIMNEVEIYPYNCVTYPEYKKIFNQEIVNEYFNFIKNDLKIDEYVSIYFRTLDLQDNLEFFEQHKEKIESIIHNNSKVFLCSNSYHIKKWVKDNNFTNVFMFNIPGEDIYGNHFNQDLGYRLLNNLILNGVDTLKERTKYMIYDILSLSFSTEINKLVGV